MTDNDTPWYTQFYGRDYLQALGPGLTNTAQEAEFVVSALALRPGDRVLDLACGQGRHAVLLAKRGIDVTGQDQSAEYLQDARAAAERHGVDLPLVNSDMRTIPFEGQFDAVISMFTSFGYFESEADNRQVLAEISKALKPDGHVLIDLVNREWVIANNQPTERRENSDGTVVLERRELNLQTSRNHVTFTFVDRNGKRRESVGHQIRLYTLTEIIQMMAGAGLTYVRVYGGFDSEPYTPSTRRMIVIARNGS
ncbi:MAG: class I SAM-dependent methyltransferase [Chloroflexi bacterium]|nr:class I SAM-dependent methyltransferase [Chloroflexota bacterium]MCH8910831.1 class I SAM-dependent methyltransferase [Chloroflexota bacterium]